ncbi:DUF4920 domain-containing protein [Kangiella sp. TOML190]|uniref:DUF4920 domain-containing protein n=1 Tax=Kangiella sp. TOML190 TaxID=2931351 RepID=UPI00204027E7|nr:DUF4920 domain-containing protein [Kangiella sp. TOML190]
MNKLSLLLLLIMAIGQAVTAETKTPAIMLGDKVDMQQQQPLVAVMADPSKYQDQTITLQGKIIKVCKKKGCWADIATDNANIRIKVPDDEIVIPIYAVGRQAYATGVLSAKTLNKAQTISYLEHMANDAGEAFDPETVTEGMILYQLNAKAVQIL